MTVLSFLLCGKLHAVIFGCASSLARIKEPVFKMLNFVDLDVDLWMHTLLIIL